MRLAGDGFCRLVPQLDQFQMIARRSHALIEINAALMRYIDNGPARLSASETSVARYAQIGAIVCRNTQAWMADHSLSAGLALRLRGLSKMAAASGEAVLRGKSALQLLVEINLHGLANL